MKLIYQIEAAEAANITEADLIDNLTASMDLSFFSLTCDACAGYYNFECQTKSFEDYENIIALLRNINMSFRVDIFEEGN